MRIAVAGRNAAGRAALFPDVVGVVPVRYASRRWPGKALAVVGGRPLVAWAWETLRQVPEVARAVIATDDERIAAWAREAGAPVVMTAASCRNGTERVAEVAEMIPADLYVNVQADQVALEPRAVGRLVRTLAAHPAWPMATLATRDGVAAARRNPDRVFVAIGSDGLARRFERGCPLADGGASSRGGAQEGGRVPWDSAKAEDASASYARHLGVYAYRRDALIAYAAASPSEDELALGLEQCRALALGWPIKVVRVRSRAWSCDRPEDAASR